MHISIYVKRVVVVLVLCSLTLLSGCGAIFNGSNQTIEVNSAPSGTKVSSDPNIGDYTTPTSIQLERKSNYVLTFSKDGYEPATARIQKKLSGGILVLDILFTGLLGVVVDAATGAWYKLSPEMVSVSLTAQPLSDGQTELKAISVELTVSESDGDRSVTVQSSEPGVQVHIEQTN